MTHLFEMLRKFRSNEDGAVTADWVVLTAVVLGLGFPVVMTVKGGQQVLAGKISSSLSNKAPD